jgi:hypothetical protein
MGLRAIAAADLKAIVENTSEFGWPVTVTKPGGPSVAMVGLSTDISQTIDPDTGQAVSGRNASVTLVMSSLLTAFSELPRGVADGVPWVVQFDDIAGAAHSFKVLEALPDRAIGCVVCLLEFYKLQDS